MEAKEIIEWSLSYLNITKEELLSPTRGLRHVSDSRHMIIYLVKNYTGMNKTKMGELFKRNGTSIMRSLIKFESFYNQEDSFRSKYDLLYKHLFQ